MLFRNLPTWERTEYLPGLPRRYVHNTQADTSVKYSLFGGDELVTTRSRNKYTLSAPRIQLTKQSFNYKGPTIWNKIPDDVKYSNMSDGPFRSFNAFKTRLKSHILNMGITQSSFILSQIYHPNEYYWFPAYISYIHIDIHDSSWLFACPPAAPCLSTLIVCNSCIMPLR